MATARFLVSGKVQGVRFRASTREQALALGLRGHALNLPSGEVEVLAVGTPQAIARRDSVSSSCGVLPNTSRNERRKCDGEYRAAAASEFRSCGRKGALTMRLRALSKRTSTERRWRSLRP